ncbi:general secretion pathway protein GspK [Acidiphilium sp. PA]|uniref:general secretion pathway protein GspK n=1 Tax=Acidiphilium sp. PA TaxID=2871705 RepID=UPI0022440C6B|nr:type II secretion system protein GspK [Acidiphilium sp. PA]MCW8306044.1 general secretion pathway protein GspK [Acidiphilium sp. PA]
MTGRAPRDERQSGVALIIVLWTVVLLMFLVGHIEAAGRDEARLALNLRRGAALQSQADGAIAVAAFHNLDQTAAHWPADGQIHLIDVHGDAFVARIRVALIDQSGKININAAPASLLQALIVAVGRSRAQAAAVASSIVQWRAPDADAQHAVHLAAQYRAGGHRLGPPGTPFESLSELGLVAGVSPRLLNALRPYLTLYGNGGVNLAYAAPAVRRAVAMGAGAGAAFMPHPPGLRVIEITATASGPGRSRFTRRAIVRLGSQAGGWMRILAWFVPAAQDGRVQS